MHSFEVELAQLCLLRQRLEEQLSLVVVDGCCASHPGIVFSHLEIKVTSSGC